MPDTIPLKGRGQTASEIPVSLEAAKAYFQDVQAFLHKIDAIETVRPLAKPGAFLSAHHPVGAFDYKVVVVTVLDAVWDEGGMTLKPLDFDADKHQAAHPVVKGFTDGRLTLREVAPGRTAVSFSFEVTIDLPIEGLLRFLPRALVQTTGDGILTFEIGRVVQNLFKKVLDDFALTAVVPQAAGAETPAGT